MEVAVRSMEISQNKSSLEKNYSRTITSEFPDEGCRSTCLGIRTGGAGPLEGIVDIVGLLITGDILGLITGTLGTLDNENVC